MPLFIDRLPLHRQGENWTVSLAVFPTDAEATPPSAARYQRWVFDSGFSGEAFCTRLHLEDAGLNPDEHLVRRVRLTAALGAAGLHPARDVALWVQSNIPAFRDRPWRLKVGRGVAFRNERVGPPHRPLPPLLGMKLFRAAGLRLFIDLAGDTVSIWTPGTVAEGILLAARRTLDGFATLPPPWPIDR